MRRYGYVILVALLGLVIPAQASAALKPITKVHYGPNEGELLNIYPQPANSNAPTVVIIHGGGWSSLSLSNFATISGNIDAEAHAVIFNINYRLDSPTQPAFPMQVEDTELATRYAIAHTAEHGGNPSNIILLGGSAGGQLAAIGAERLNASHPGTVHSVVTLSGIFNFPLVLQEIREKHKGLTKSFILDVQQALGCSLETTCKTPEAEEFAREWSPTDQVTSTDCPASWLMYNSSEELVPIEQPNGLTEVLKADGCLVNEQILPGKLHSTAYWLNISSQVVEYIMNTGSAISVTKQAEQASFKAVGETITYHYTVKNNGTVTLKTVTLTDNKLGAITGCDAETLAPKAETTCEAKTTVTQEDLDAGSIVNVATAEGKNSSGETVKNTATHTVPAETTSAIGVTKVAEQASFKAVGETITYHYTVKNNGTVTLKTVTLTDNKLGAITGCDAETLAPKAETTCEAKTTVTQEDLTAGSIVNVATAEGKNPFGETVTNTATDTVPAEA